MSAGVHQDALVSLDAIMSSIAISNADDASFPGRQDVTLGDVTVELTRIANGGRDPRPANEHAADIAQFIMADLIHALEEAAA
ncbi:hypothetical protein IHQ68_08005 [Chelatococcus sambhunathii]|uniref:Uncharacterized protein n=1 Tax=Chelatococcus sambhunathii TaxID=363953 RepID=A0ABU1DEL2_9HYPH|nr:hypothetical protein [Chelatococcus sambhunathii]MDR4306558.1 hypothetical protein [Chelatococcus sambhunathii]